MQWHLCKHFNYNQEGLMFHETQVGILLSKFATLAIKLIKTILRWYIEIPKKCSCMMSLNIALSCSCACNVEATDISCNQYSCTHSIVTVWSLLYLPLYVLFTVNTGNENICIKEVSWDWYRDQIFNVCTWILITGDVICLYKNIT